MDALEVLSKRHSVRKFADTPVARESVEKMVDCARFAATAMGIQPWEFVIVTDINLRKRLADTLEFGKFVAQAPVAIVVLCKETKYYLEDGCNATENLLLAATALGLDSCWVAGDKKPYVDFIRSLVGAPAGFRVIAVVAVGYAAEETGSPAKRPLEEVIHWEKF